MGTDGGSEERAGPGLPGRRVWRGQLGDSAKSAPSAGALSYPFDERAARALRNRH